MKSKEDFAYLLNNAIAYREIERVNQLIQEGADPNQLYNGKTALHYACETSNPEIVQTLIEAGADINALDSEGKTPLDLTSSLQLDIIKALFEGGAKYDPDRISCFSALNNACRTGDFEFVKILLDAGADVNTNISPNYAYYNKIDTPLTVACDTGRLDIAKELVSRGADVNFGSFDNPPLHLACKDNDFEFVKILLDAGANLNVTDRNRDTPLHIAINNQRLDIAKELVARGADVNASNKDYHRPLDIAYRKNDIELAKELIKAGAKIDMSYVHEALRSGNLEFVKVLVEGADDINRTDSTRYPYNTILHHFYNEGNSEMVEFLLSKGATFSPEEQEILQKTLVRAVKERDIEKINKLTLAKLDLNVQNDREGTVLHIACRDRNANIVKILLENGARTDIKDHHGSQPLDIAFNKNDVEITRMLIEAGAINFTEDKGYKLLKTAISYKNFELFQALVEGGADFNVPSYEGTLLYQELQNFGDLNRYGSGYSNRGYATEEEFNTKQDFSEKVIKALLAAGAKLLPTEQIAFQNPHYYLNFSLTQYLCQAGVDINAPNQEGKTPLQFVYENEYFNEYDKEYNIRGLAEAGADINVRNSDGKTLLESAFIDKKTKLVIALSNSGADIDLISEEAFKKCVPALTSEIMEGYSTKSAKLVTRLLQTISAKANETIPQRVAIDRQEERATGAAEGRATEARVTDTVETSVTRITEDRATNGPNSLGERVRNTLMSKHAPHVSTIPATKQPNRSRRNSL